MDAIEAKRKPSAALISPEHHCMEWGALAGHIMSLRLATKRVKPLRRISSCLPQLSRRTLMLLVHRLFHFATASLRLRQ
jgi:hypothetical protein